MTPEIQKTDDYILFKYYPYNRDVKWRKVDKLAKSITDLDLTPYNPILCDETFHIIDGQHRFEACKALNIPIYYVVIPGHIDTNTAIQRLNVEQHVWRLWDYVSKYAKLGYPVYKEMVRAKQAYGYNDSITIQLVCQSPGSGSAKAVRAGTAKKGPVDVDFLAKVLDDYKAIFDWATKVQATRAISVLASSPEYNHKVHFRRVKKQRMSMFECATQTQYIEMFEAMINKGLIEKSRIKLIHNPQ